jgi:cell fate regulator YaaT (PSP1 superfamily)
LKKNLPKKNSRVRTAKAEARVVDVHLLTQLVVVEYEEGEREVVPVEDIQLITGAHQKQKKNGGTSKTATRHKPLEKQEKIEKSPPPEQTEHKDDLEPQNDHDS